MDYCLPISERQETQAPNVTVMVTPLSSVLLFWTPSAFLFYPWLVMAVPAAFLSYLNSCASRAGSPSGCKTLLCFAIKAGLWPLLKKK